jgi:hypothetical protein
MNMNELDRLESAVGRIAKDKALRDAQDAGRPDPSEAELRAIEDEANRKATFGFDYKVDSRGEPIQVGIGSASNPTGNHLASILKYEGPTAYQKELRRIWKETPDIARRRGFPEPTRAGG